MLVAWLLFGNILNLFWQFLWYVLWQVITVVISQILKNDLAIWSHWPGMTFVSAIELCSISKHELENLQRISQWVDGPTL